MSDFLEGYDLGAYLVKPNTKTGQAGISEGISAGGEEVIVREWRRKKGDEDLVDIWRHELRQLYRLGGYPGADKYICPVLNAGLDDKGYYIVLSAVQKRPLQVFLEGRTVRASWLRGLSQSRNRKRVWENITQIVYGLGILHREGMVHRNIDTWSILTSAGTEPDFQLTGFEWSLRLSGTEDKTKKTGKNTDIVSFAKDWADLAKLIATIFNLNLKSLNDLKIPDHRVHDTIPSSEIKLLRDLLAPSLFDNFNSSIVVQRIKEILSDLEASSGSAEANWTLVFALSQSSSLSKLVRKASGNEVEITDRNSQLRWVNDDLSPTANLISTIWNGVTKYWLEGREVAYEIRPFEPKDRTPNWRIAIAANGILKANLRKDNQNTVPIPFHSIRPLLVAEAHTNYNRIVTKAPDWSNLFSGLLDGKARYTTSSERLVTAFYLLHAIDVALTTSNIFPVTIVSNIATEQRLKLQYRPNQEIENLAKALGLDTPEKRFEETLSKDGFEGGESWILTDAVNIGKFGQSGVELEFISQSKVPGDHGHYEFYNNNTIYFENSCYLQHSSLRGSASLLRRRSKALDFFNEHTELMESLSDPRERISDTHEKIDFDAAFSDMDPAKQTALKQIVGVLPMYLLQGPPGVGKTYLLREIVRRCFQDDHTSRLLITSQGNHAIDHLVSELSDMWNKEGGETPLTVRCRSRESNSFKTPYDIENVSKKLISDIANSKLTESSSLDLNTRMKDCVNDNTTTNGEINALESLILRSANVVLATTNSHHVATLLNEHAQFDWTIVEEAAKATGGELIAPLMLSHRRLLIGDHKQLPPFGSREIGKILSTPTKLKDAIKSLPSLLDRSVLHLLNDEIEERLGDSIEDMEDICNRTSQVLFLFESILTEELDLQKKNAEVKKIGGALSEQHRMQEALCRIVSHTFYDDKLTTAERKIAESESSKKWISSSNKSLLPNAPFVTINMPYERTTVGSGRFEQTPRFSNPSEVNQVLEAINNLKVASCCGDQKPSLVILSPYMEQVKLIKSELTNASNALSALKQFKPATQGNDWVATVDSFQGNEADVVIFSLVRNNRSAWITSALGFVSDQRRFNVLLSRAREKFVFIGSREFLNTISMPMGGSTSQESEFVRKFLAITDELVVEGLHKIRNVSMEEILQ